MNGQTIGGTNARDIGAKTTSAVQDAFAEQEQALNQFEGAITALEERLHACLSEGSPDSKGGPEEIISYASELHRAVDTNTVRINGCRNRVISLRNRVTL